MSNFENKIIPNVESIAKVTTSTGWWTDLLNSVLLFVKNSIFWILAVISIGAFIYIGFMLIKAQWNPEELKKAFMNFIHIIIWLFIVVIAWALVTMVSGISF